jgi:two-component system OmpR family response regulator
MDILIVDDDRTTVVVVRKALAEFGHNVDSAFDADEAVKCASEHAYDLFILDRMLPSRDGLTLLKELRRTNPEVPALFLTAMSSIQDRITGLDEGADDYLVKPFALGELVARVNSVMRRYKVTSVPTRWVVDTLEFELLSRDVSRSGTKINLQPRELKILEVLLRNRGEIISKAMLLREVWGLHFDPGTSVVQTNVSRLRAKVDLPGEKPLIHTLRGFGYQLDDKG